MAGFHRVRPHRHSEPISFMKLLFPLLLISTAMGCASPEPEQSFHPNAPRIQSPDPIIYLADNLDEQDQLGFCIDTDGKGFSDSLQVHSCKPNGDDVLFYYDRETQQICSATYPGFCAAMLGGPQVGMTISLVESDPESPDQKFGYDDATGEFWPTESESLCLAAGSESDDAGPYMSRTLSLQPRASIDKRLKTWVVRGAETQAY